MLNLSEREYGLAANSLRLHGRKLLLDIVEMRETAKYDGDLAVCNILEEQANEQLALADKIDEGMWE